VLYDALRFAVLCYGGFSERIRFDYEGSESLQNPFEPQKGNPAGQQMNR
jgi:hypothetical protein